jgi:hypothetical protein
VHALSGVMRALLRAYKDAGIEFVEDGAVLQSKK